MKKEYLPYGKEKAGRAIWEVLKRMYREAEPSADLEKIAKSGEGNMRNFFCAYLLSSEREEEILDEVCEEFKIKKVYRRQVEATVWLGSAPTSSREVWEEERKDYEQRLKKHLQKRSLNS
ncbi:MAG: hypothetical protein AABX91_01195 [Nanoarchaeota archaeon]